MLPKRIETSNAELNTAESAWWDEYAGVEQRYCWEQTAPIQRFLRGGYIRKMVGLGAKRFFDFGCGTGWVARCLVEQGAAEVYGVDFSPEQERRAQEYARRGGVFDKIRFGLLRTSNDLKSVFESQKFDTFVFHGVLHHLTCDEIREVVATCRERANDAARILIVEPILYPADGSDRYRLLKQAIDWLVYLPMAGTRFGLRQRSREEVDAQQAINRRQVVPPPRGPSPKEQPFAPGELETLLTEDVIFENSQPVLTFSFHIAKSLLLMQLSHPTRARLIMWPYLWLARTVERLIMRFYHPLPDFTTFELKIGRFRT